LALLVVLLWAGAVAAQDPTPPPLPGDLDSLTQLAETQHPVLQQARVALDVARLETVKARAGHKPTIDLTASYALNNNPHGSPTSSIGTRSKSATG